MKKTLFIVVLVAALALAFAGVASANGGPHGGYTATTDACAGCHRAHTATGPNLLVASSTYNLCITCHGAAGSGANTNVDDGQYLSTRDDALFNGDVGASNTPDNAYLLGGGFVNQGGAVVTSTHAADGTLSAAWGNGVARGITANLTSALTCASCHDPHGSANYRIIKATVNGTAVAAAPVDEGAAKDYDTEQWGTGQSTICAACHSDYHQTNPGQGSILAGATYTHRIGMSYAYGSNANPEGGWTDSLGTTVSLPLAETGTNNTVECQTCHLPHGTSASMTAAADGPNQAGSNLLRLDNRGVCEACHQK
ncbi:MAG: hypothetical protein L3J16_05205 [Anaerolineales bacterium]|nr:hypothetical protein [Anaerolineales bacterium]